MMYALGHVNNQPHHATPFSGGKLHGIHRHFLRADESDRIIF